MFFWRDALVSATPLLDVALKEIPLLDWYRMVHDYWDAARGWIWEKLVRPEKFQFREKW